MDVAANNPVYAFADFRLDPARRLLLKKGEAIALHPKAFDLLVELVENRDRVLSKNELLNTVWEGQFVEEGNLAVQIFALRKIFGEKKGEPRFIVTVPGKGYRFVADVREADGDERKDFISEGEAFTRFVAFSDKSDEITANGHAKSSVASKKFPSQGAFLNRKSVLLVAVSAVLLAAGLGGYRFFQNRPQQPAIVSEPARQQMTITRVTDGRASGAATISPDGKFIAYGENATSGAGTLYVRQTDTHTVLQLLEPDNRQVGCILFSPDSSLIYYKVTDARDLYGAFYSISVLGKTPKRIMDNFSGCPTLSPDGRRIAFYRDDPENRRRSLIISDLENGGERNLFARSHDEMRFGSYLAWQPDGNSIVFNADPESLDLKPSFTVFRVSLENGATAQLTTERFAEFGKMSWTNDGQNLVFVAKYPRKENQLYRMDYPSGEVRRITNDLASYGNAGLGITADSGALVADVWERVSELWSIDASGDASKAVQVKSGTTNGRLGIAGLSDGRIAYIASVGNNPDVWTVKEDGTDAKSLTADSFAQKDVAASPDGRYLVFASDQAGENHIFRMNSADGSELTQLTFGATSDSQPDISPDGNWVVYSSSDGKRNTVWKVPLAGGAGLQLTDYESVSPVFAPDGKWVACVLPSDTRPKPGSIAIIPADGGGKPVKSFQVMPFTYFPVIRWTPDGKTVVYRNLQQGVHNLWRQPLSGDAPRQFTDFTSGEIWNFAYSRDGKRILLSRGNTLVNVVLIKNFR